MKKLLFFNSDFTINSMKFKTPNHEYIKICLDRLTRFKPVSERYERVFDDILNKFLITKDDISDDDSKIELAVKIFNSVLNKKSDFRLNEIIKEDENKIFNLTSQDEKFLNSKIDFESALDLFELNELPLNLKRLKLQKTSKSEEVRENFSTLFPVSKIILVEGITEEILLIEFARILGLDFKKRGYYVIGAGGKNQVARKYYKLIEEVKIPIFILLDFDADEVMDLINHKLRKIDTAYKINSGEFEDILPKNLIKNALNHHFHENMHTEDNDFEEGSTVDDLNVCYKNNGWGEFKKAAFAKIIREYLLLENTFKIEGELETIVELIKGEK